MAVRESSILVILIVPALAMTAGIVLILFGTRGRRVDDHPLCRRCGFDLTGRPQTSDRCPECGADLSAHRAIRIGRRTRRPWSIALGIVFVLLSLIAATFVIRSRASD